MGVAIMGAAMLPEDLWYGVPFGTGYCYRNQECLRCNGIIITSKA